MKLTYLGTGASEGIPALFCNCEYCRRVRAGNGRVHSRSQVLIDGELSIDFPPDAFYHEAVLGADLSQIRYLLVTHAHMDHFSAHNFIMRGYKYALNMKEQELSIYANKEVLEVYSENTRREYRKDVAEHITLTEIQAFQKVCFGGYTVYPLKAAHNTENPLLFLIEKGGKRVLHLTDTGMLPFEDYAFLRALGGKIDLINFDCTFLWGMSSASGRHMGLYENMEVLSRLYEAGVADENSKCVITHFSHNSAPSEENLKRAEEHFGVIAAYDGLTITI